MRLAPFATWENTNHRADRNRPEQNVSLFLETLALSSSLDFELINIYPLFAVENLLKTCRYLFDNFFWMKGIFFESRTG